VQPEALKEFLHRRHLRLTAERLAVLQAFVSAKKMLTPHELHALVADANVGLTTVYRVLELLTKHRCAQPFLVEGEVRYAFCSEEHHHHFICLSCHAVAEIFDCPEPVAADLPQGQVQYHALDFYGRCSACLEGGSPC
jgi:Fe2+ or Zn2+ uptake regulation protein